MENVLKKRLKTLKGHKIASIKYKQFLFNKTEQLKNNNNNFEKLIKNINVTF